MFIKRLIKPLFRSPETIEESEKLRKHTLLYILLLLGILFLIFMSILLFLEEDYFYSVLNLCFGVFLIVLFFLIRTGKGLRVYSILSISLLQIFLMYLFHSGAGDQMAFVWYYLFPLVSLFLLGIKPGVFLSLMMIGLSLFLNYFSGYIPSFIHVPTGRILRILCSYIGVMLFAVVFEHTRLITQNKLENTMSELNELAIRDGLTGLYNRRYMDEVIYRTVQQCQRTGMTIGFIMADIDYFKKYNDTYGHQAGDVLLSAFAKMLLSLVRRQTDFVFRYGGEEFTLILPSTSMETTGYFAEEIIRRTRELAIPHQDSPFKYATVSVGAVNRQSPCTIDFHELIRMADESMYEAKNSGRNRFVMKNNGSVSR